MTVESDQHGFDAPAPPGLVVEDPIFPPTETLRLSRMETELPVWSGTVDIVVPFYAVGELASETRPLDSETAEIEVGIRYQACDDAVCFPPQTEKLVLQLDLDVIDVPALGTHMGHGQRERNYNGMPRLMWKTIKLEIAAKRRSLKGK